MKIISSLISKRQIEIKGVSKTQKTALYLLAGILGLRTARLEEREWEIVEVTYGYKTELPSGLFTVYLDLSTTLVSYEKTLGELSSLFATMQSSSLDGWPGAESNSEI